MSMLTLVHRQVASARDVDQERIPLLGMLFVSVSVQH